MGRVWSAVGPKLGSPSVLPGGSVIIPLGYSRDPEVNFLSVKPQARS